MIGGHQLDGGGGYGQRFLRSGLTGVVAPRLVGCLPTGPWGWNEARPVLEGDRASCANSGLDTVSFPGRACHPLNPLREEGMAVAIVESTRPVTGGVDTHLDSHVAAALDASGAVLGVESFLATRAGYVSLSS